MDQFDPEIARFCCAHVRMSLSWILRMPRCPLFIICDLGWRENTTLWGGKQISFVSIAALLLFLPYVRSGHISHRLEMVFVNWWPKIKVTGYAFPACCQIIVLWIVDWIAEALIVRKCICDRLYHEIFVQSVLLRVSAQASWLLVKIESLNSPEHIFLAFNLQARCWVWLIRLQLCWSGKRKLILFVIPIILLSKSELGFEAARAVLIISRLTAVALFFNSCA